MNDKTDADWFVWLGGVVVIAHLEWEPGDRGSNPGSRHYSIGQQPWAGWLLTLPPPVTQLQETAVRFKSAVLICVDASMELLRRTWWTVVR